MKAMPMEICCCRRRTRQRRAWLWGLIAAAVSAVSNLPAANPLLPGADPHALVVGDTVWVYPTWSDDRRGQRFFAFSSTNWTDWRRHGPVLDLTEVKWIKDDGADQHRAWAPGVLEKDGRWFFYYSVGPQNPTPSRIGVAVGDSPAGPFRDHGKPLLTGGHGFEAIDPMAFTDPASGNTYLYAGGSAGAKLRVFELNPDLVSFAREVPVETPPRFTEGAFMHVHAGRYYLSYSHGGWRDASYSVHYATAESPVGPWTYHGAVLSSDATRKGPGHHSFIRDPRTDDLLIVYHRWENQTGDGPYRGQRQVCRDRVEYDANGLIQPIRMTSGPGNAGLQAGAPTPGPALAHRAEQGPAHEQRYPASSAVVDVTQPPYAARGDGVTDDTEALQRAFNENVGHARVLYLPAGTYLVSRTLTWPKRWEGRENWGFTTLRGQHRDRTVIRLKDHTFTDTTEPQAILWCGGFGSADWFHNYVENLTFDVGRGNPAAVALQFYSNNSGAVRDCRFVAPSGSGWVGLDLAHRDMNGPVFVTRCEVTGFRRGIVTGHSVNSQTFEHLALRGQSEFGFDNTGQAIAIRGLVSDNAVPAVRSYGTLALIEAKLTGRNGAEKLPAIVNYNGGRLLLRDITTRGYGRALGDVATPDYLAAFRLTGEDQPGSAGPDIAEYFSHAPTRLFPGPGRSLRLPIRETPLTPWDEPATWANGVDFGADPTGQADASAAIQKAVDSGATTVFLPGNFNLRTPVILRGKVRRLLGTGGSVNYGKGLRPDFRLEEGDAPVVFIEHFGNIHGGLQVDTRRTLVLRSVQDCDLTFTDRAAGGDRFFEDFVTHRLRLIGQSVWARQLNVENEGTHLVNDAGDLWILGYKTERGGTLLETRNAGRSEVLGNFSYTTTAGKLAPMLVIRDAALFAFFHEVCYNGDPFETWVQETRGTQTRFLRRGEGSLLPFVGFAP